MTVIRPDVHSPDWWDQVDALYNAELDRRDYARFVDAEAVDAYYAALDTPPVDRYAEFNVDDRNQDHEHDHAVREPQP